MKQCKLVLLGLAALTVLSGCGDPTNVNPPVTNESTYVDKTDLWDNTLKRAMNQTLRELLPYIELKGQLNVNILKNQRNEDILYIFETGENLSSKTEEYRSIVEKAPGYQLLQGDKPDGENIYYNFNKDYEDGGTMALRFGFFKGSEDPLLPAGFEIYASYTAPIEYSTDWSNEEKSLLLTNLEQLIPFPNQLSTKHESFYDAEIKQVVIRDLFMTTDIYDNYITTLYDNGYVAVGDGTGFFTYEKICDNDSTEKIVIDMYNYNNLGAVGVEIYATRRKNITKTTEWPSDAINEFYKDNEDVREIPGYLLSDVYYYWDDGEHMTIRARCSKSLFEEQLSVYERMGWTCKYNSEFDTYIIINSKGTIALLVDFNEAGNSLDIEINILNK